MLKLTQIPSSIALTALLMLGLNVPNSWAEGGSGFGPAVDSFCSGFDGSTPFADGPSAFGSAGCGLCHAPAFEQQPQWSWWRSGDFSPFCTGSSGNNAPVADAGADQSVTAGEVVTLNGGGSSDVDGDALSYLWSLIDAPAGSGAVLSDPTAVMPDFTADVAGEYVAQLVVDDGTTDSAPNTVTIVAGAGNSAPVADAGADQSVGVDDAVTLNGSGSSDVDGDALGYQWALISVPTGSSAELSDAGAVMPGFVADVAGEYVAELVVDDGEARSAADSVTIVASVGNTAPVADAGTGQTVAVGTAVVLDGSGSSDVDGDALSYQWSLTSRPAGSNAALSDPSAVMSGFVADVAGDYVAQLVVDDGTAGSTPDTVTIMTSPGNSAPVADAGTGQTVAVGEQVNLNGSDSSDADGDTLSYRWSFTSIPPGSNAVISDPSAAMPVFTVDLPGDYVAQLVVNDGLGDSAPDTVTIATGPGNSAPVADAGGNQIVTAGDAVTLDGGDSGDADGDALSYQWSLTARPAGSAAALSDPNAVTPGFTADVAGEYVAQLVVNDGTTDSAPDTVMVTADAAPAPGGGGGGDEDDDEENDDEEGDRDDDRDDDKNRCGKHDRSHDRGHCGKHERSHDRDHRRDRDRDRDRDHDEDDDHEEDEDEDED